MLISIGNQNIFDNYGIILLYKIYIKKKNKQTKKKKKKKKKNKIPNYSIIPCYLASVYQS